MSSKLGSKPIKRAPSVPKKKGVLTPDQSSRATPTASSSSIGQQEKCPESSIDEVLQGGQVEALKIREEDLRKLHPPHPPTSHKPERTRKVVVRRTNPLAPDELPRPKHRGVAVLHPLPPGTAVSAKKTLGSPGVGPRFDRTGTFIPHSVLGPSEDYASTLQGRGMIDSATVFTRPPPVALPKVERPSTVEEKSYKMTIMPHEALALEHWNRSMEERKAQQEHLAGKLGSSPERLAMNQGDSYRTTQEERMLIDRAIPPVDYGKGYRVGSEFWSQQVRIGNETTGINTTLTQTERGLPPEFEFVGVPSAIRKEKGMTSDLEKNAPPHYTWKRSTYLSTRMSQLESTLRDSEPFRPEMSELQVIGHSPGHVPSHPPRLRADSLDSLGEGEGDELSSSEGGSEAEEMVERSFLDLQPDTASLPIIGPALRIGGELLKWEGPPASLTSSVDVHSGRQGGRRSHDLEPVDLRVIFEGAVGKMTTSHLEMENCGTTAIYYSWQRVQSANPLGTIQAGDTQRFYFDTRGGVLLPGQRLAFPFLFKSPNCGVFSETWALHTGPVLGRGKPILLTLKGITFQEDMNAQKRQEIEYLLTHKMAVAAAKQLVDKLVDSIRTPPRSPEPHETTVLEEDIFQTRNPGIFYHYNLVQQLKTLYDGILRPEMLRGEQETAVPPEPSTKVESKGGKKGEEKGGGGKKDRVSKERKEAGTAEGRRGKGKEEPSKDVMVDVAEKPSLSVEEKPAVVVPDWDLSIASLQEVVMGIEDDGMREEKLQQLSTVVGALSFPPPRYTRRRLYNIGYEILCETVDTISSVSTHLCHVMGLPLRVCGPVAIKPATEEEPTPSSVPSSPAAGGKKDKKGGKDVKKADAKQKSGGKEKDRAPSSKGKTGPAKKSKAVLSPKEKESIEAVVERVPSFPTEVDPVMEKKYRDNFYAAVYEILGSAVEKMALLFQEVA